MPTRIAVLAALCLTAADASAAPKEFKTFRTQTITATVKSVDPTTRQVTVVQDGGKELTFKASDRVKNLAQVKPGDIVVAKMDQTMTLRLLGPDEAAPEPKVAADVYEAKPGEQPGATMVADVSGVATVDSIAPDKKSVQLKGPRGNVVKLRVKDPKNLEGVKVGSRVGFTYSKTLAVDVVAKGK
jgi:Cu/Ag efflux protein CusF